MANDKILGSNSSMKLFRALLSTRIVRRSVKNKIDQKLYHQLVEDNPDNRPPRAQAEKHNLMMCLLEAVDRALERGTLSKSVLNRLLDVFVKNVIVTRFSNIEEARFEHGIEPPLFVVISPTGKCNLRCAGCYAASDPSNHVNLDFNTIDRIMTEKAEMWRSHFTVISGGEPLLWEDQGYDIIDMAKRHSSDFLMMYTNATLIDEDKARRMGEAGNISPAISVEGFEKETDARRGKGTYRKIMNAMELLRKHGVPFGISATPTKENWDIITSDEFADFYFLEQGAFYCWLFQYMPMGRGRSVDLMPTPEERLEMYERTQRLQKEKRVFIADFWNNGVTSSGCISGGRRGGYFYIDWNGDITPCVFVPYAVDNINAIYERGDTINSVLESSLFKRIRKWQDAHGYARNPEDIHNWMAPCPIRDHYRFMRRALKETGAKPITDDAEAALQDEEYYQRMKEYGDRIHELSRPIWIRDYAISQNEGAEALANALQNEKEKEKVRTQEENNASVAH
ncbi:MAG: radical SAM/SPASM domain-containing protein [Lentisphaeria bacterium]